MSLDHDPDAWHPEVQQAAPAASPVKGPRAGLVVALAALLVALAAVGGLVYQQQRISDLTSLLRSQGAELSDQVAGVQGDLADNGSRLAEVEDSLDSTKREVKAVDSKVDQQVEDTLNTREVTEAAMPSVVTVYCEDFQGSGFVSDVGSLPEGSESAVLTNYHVIEPCAESGGQVQVRKGEKWISARLVAWDPENDMALVLLPTYIPPLPTARSPKVGDPVLAIGSPYDLDGTVTSGVVSNVYPKYFQTDAAINPGNSGGPLLDRHGEVLGITTFKIPDAEGANFAVRMRVRCEQLIICE